MDIEHHPSQLFVHYKQFFLTVLALSFRLYLYQTVSVLDGTSRQRIEGVIALRDIIIRLFNYNQECVCTCYLFYPNVKDKVQ